MPSENDKKNHSNDLDNQKNIVSNDDSSGKPNDNLDNDDLNKTKDGFVKYETYRKTVGAEKKLRAKVKEYEDKLNQIASEKEEAEKEKLAEQGEYKKLLELERKKREEFEAKTKIMKNQCWTHIN